MEKIPTDQFLSFCRTLEGAELKTLARKRGFTVTVTNDGLEFNVVSTGKKRTHTRAYVESFLNRFEELPNAEAFSVQSYQDLTVNASYQAALVDLFLKKRKQGSGI